MNARTGTRPQQPRRPYPYMLQQWFDQSVGNSRYNALQVTVNNIQPWSYVPGRLYVVAYKRRRLQAGCKLRITKPV